MTTQSIEEFLAANRERFVPEEVLVPENCALAWDTQQECQVHIDADGTEIINLSEQ